MPCSFGEKWGILPRILLERKKWVHNKMDLILFYPIYYDIIWSKSRRDHRGAGAYEAGHYPAVKEDGVTNQRVTIHYNCIGTFEVPDRRKIPERDILLETRKGVALSYAPTQIAM